MIWPSPRAIAYRARTLSLNLEGFDPKDGFTQHRLPLQRFVRWRILNLDRPWVRRDESRLEMRGPATRAAGSQGRLRHDAQFENVMRVAPVEREVMWIAGHLMLRDLGDVPVVHDFGTLVLLGLFSSIDLSPRGADGKCRHAARTQARATRTTDALKFTDPLRPQLLTGRAHAPGARKWSIPSLRSNGAGRRGLERRRSQESAALRCPSLYRTASQPT